MRNSSNTTTSAYLYSTLQLAWQFFRQERHYRHQRFMRWTQVILMVFIVTLSLSSHSIQTFLQSNLNNLLGADLVLSQDMPLESSQVQQLSEMTNAMVVTQTAQTTLTFDDKWARVTLKAVGEGYPLQGELRTAVALGANDISTSNGPDSGEIWLDARLLAALNVQIGERISIAQRSFVVSRVLHHEPDRLMEGHNVEMRAMISLQDMAILGFQSDANRYRYLFSADKAQIPPLLAWQKSTLPAAQVNHKQGAHPLALFWQRTENLVGLASIILFFMAAIAIQQLTQVQMRKEQSFAAICMSFGSSKQGSMQLAAIKWCLHMLALLPAVLVISGICHFGIVQWMSQTFIGLQWQWQLGVALKASFSTSMIFAIFYLPVLLGIRQASIAQLIHHQQQRANIGVSLLCAIAVLAGIAAAYSDNGLLTAMILGAMAVCIALILVLSWLTLTMGEKLTKNVSGLMPFALFMMKQRLMTKTTQVLGVGLCAFLLLFTLMLMRDLGGSMANYQRQHDGNLLVTQATDVQMNHIQQWSQEHGAQVRQSKPFMYAKLTSINGTHLSDYTDKPSDSLATLQRRIRLHWTDTVPANNRVNSGQWWQGNTDDWQQISMEEEVMTDLGLSLGDSLTFQVAEQLVAFTIVASHVYQPGAGSITFWVQMPSLAVDHLNAQHYVMASVEVPPSAFSELASLWQQYPTLRMVSLKEMTARFDSLLAMVTQVISGFSFLIILLASIVIVSSIQSSEHREKQKNSIIMSFGFDKSTCLTLNLIEWLVTGSIAACGAILGTWLAGVLIYQSQFSMVYQPDFLWLLGTLAVILLFVTLLGVLASRKSISGSIRELLVE